MSEHKCEYQEKWDEASDIDDGVIHYYATYSNWFMIHRYSTEDYCYCRHHDAIIRFCPFCGKKLDIDLGDED